MSYRSTIIQIRKAINKEFPKLEFTIRTVNKQYEFITINITQNPNNLDSEYLYSKIYNIVDNDFNFHLYYFFLYGGEI